VDLGFETLGDKVGSQIGQTGRDYDKVGIERVHWLNVAIDCQASDQTVGSEQFTRSN
jgi:hypothetical protein